MSWIPVAEPIRRELDRSRRADLERALRRALREAHAEQASAGLAERNHPVDQQRCTASPEPAQI